MTDALMDRIKAHRSAPTVYDPPTFDQMVDRIKQLEESNKELTLQLLAVHGQAADALDKLTKTVEALRDTTQMLSQCTFTIIRMKGQYFERHEVVDNARAVLAELGGKE